MRSAWDDVNREIDDDYAAAEEREADMYRLPRKSVRELIDEMRERLTGKDRRQEPEGNQE